VRDVVDARHVVLQLAAESVRGTVAGENTTKDGILDI
jgi:hypothetical protein